jgi:calreticulin
VKILPPGFKAEAFDGGTVYNVMFGPDICGKTNRIHVIINYNGETHLIKKHMNAKTDQMTHLYTLLIKPDQTYRILVDLEEIASGSLTEDWSLLPPASIRDPSAKKPETWVDDSMMDDPNDKKPEDWKEEPENLVDLEANIWEPSFIPNPDFKGSWKPKRIKNPDYKGAWVPPEIPNPDYKYDPNIYAFKSAFIGFDLWQVKAGTIFDNIIITDSLEDAMKFAKETFLIDQPKEKAAKDLLDKQQEERLELVQKELAKKDENKRESAGVDLDSTEDDHVEL